MAIKPNLDERHEYRARLVWTGAKQGPTTSYQAYSREYEYQLDGKTSLRGSADPHFRGDPTLHNPEELLVMALSSCHLLSYLAECARAGVHVVAYEDDAHGLMGYRDGKMRLLSVELRPRVTIAPDSDMQKAVDLHHAAHDGCFIASSVNFPVTNKPEVAIGS